jgi:hypothetical protein
MKASIRRMNASQARPATPARPANGPERMSVLVMPAKPWCSRLGGIAPMNASCSRQ